MPANVVNRYHFIVNWGGTRVGFAEVSGLDIEVEAVSFRDGSGKEDSAKKIPGLRKFSNITLKRGIISGDNEFFDWINTKSSGNIERRDVTISLLSETHEPIVTWRIKNAFPVKYYGPLLNANSGEIAMEALELTHEGLSIVS